MFDGLRAWFGNIGPSYPAAFFIAAVVTLGLTPFVRRLAIAKGVVDRPDRARRVHTRTTPRWGGLAIAAGFFASLVVLSILGTGVARYFAADRNRALVIGVGGLAMLLLGAYDDARGANAWLKLAVQIPAALLLVFLGFSFDVITLPWGGALDVGGFGGVLAVVWVVGVTNAINLIDGLDGLAAGVSFVAVVTTFVVAVAGGNLVMAMVCAALAGALLGFLFHNYHPASIFMGDAGSLFIGYVVAAGSVMANFKSQTTVALAIPVLLLGVPIVDTLLAFFRRMLRGRSPLSADKEHIHHRLLSRGMSHGSAVLMMWGMAVLCAVATLMVYFSQARNAVWVLLGYGLLVFFGARRLGYIRFERWGSEFRQGRVARGERKVRREVVRQAVARIREATDLTRAFDVLVGAHAVHGCDEVVLELHVADGGPPTRLVWQRLPHRPRRFGTPAALIRALTPVFGSLVASPPEPADEPSTEAGVPRRRGEPQFEAGFDLELPEGQLGSVRYRSYEAGRAFDVEDEALLSVLHAALTAPIQRHLGRPVPPA